MSEFLNALFTNLRTFMTAGIVNAWEGAQSDAAKLIVERSELTMETDEVDAVDLPPLLSLDELIVQ